MSHQADTGYALEEPDREPPTAPEATDLPEVTMADLHRTCDLARAEIARADAKAGLLAAIAIPIAGILLAVPSLTPLRGAIRALASAAATFMLVGIVYLGAVVWPQLRGDVGISFVSATPPDRLAEVIMKHSVSPAERRAFAAAESNLLARLATAKFRRIRRAILFFGLGTTLLFVTCISLTVGNLD